MDDKNKDENEVVAEFEEAGKVSFKDEENIKTDKIEERAVVEIDDKNQNSQYDEKSYSEGPNRMKDNPNEQPYNRNTEVKRTTSDDSGSVAMILGIIAIVCAVTGILSLIGLVLGIIAIVNGAKVRKFSSSGMAGWVLGIISVVVSSGAIILSIAFFANLIWFSPYFMYM